MKSTKLYQTSSRGVIVVVVAAIVMTLVSILSYQQGRIDNWIPWAYVLVLLAVALDMKFGIYAKRQGDYFCETKHFLYHRCIKVSCIAKIMYQPTWVIGENTRSLYLLDSESGAIKIKMANGAYSVATLREIANDLVKLNPTIELDVDARQLMQPKAKNEDGKNGDRHI